jgi:protein O-mannosyl-transferase
MKKLFLFSSFAIVIGVTLGVYLNSLECDFVFDDHLAIRNNRDIQTASLTQLWANDFWGRPLTNHNSHKSWRPLTILTFRWNYYFAELNAQYYHLTNLFLHIINTLLVCISSFFFFFFFFFFIYSFFIFSPLNSLTSQVMSLNFFITSLLLTPSQSNPSQPTTSPTATSPLTYTPHIAAFISGLLFGVHSVHVEAVTGVVGRAELLSCFFVILCFYCSIRALHSPSFIHSVCGMCGAAIFFFCGVLSKETSVTVLGWIGVYDLFCYTLPLIFTKKSSLTNTSPHSNTLNILTPFLYRFFILIFFFITYLILRVSVMSETFSFTDATLQHSLLIRKTENPFHFISHPIARILSKLYIQAKYALLLLYPQQLCAEWSYNCIPAIRDLTDFRIIAIIFLITFCLCTFYLLLTAPPLYRPCLLYFLWCIIAHTPGSGLFFTLGTLVAERLMYLPSVGYCLFIGHLSAICMLRMAEKEKKKKKKKNNNNNKKIDIGEWVWKCGEIIFILYVIWSIFFMSYRTWQRNIDWVSDKSLFLAAIETCPESAKMHRQVGQVCVKKNLLSLMIYFYFLKLMN